MVELVPRVGAATGAGLEGAVVEVFFSSVCFSFSFSGAPVEEEVCEEEEGLVLAIEEVEGRVEARVGVGFRLGGGRDGVMGMDTGFMSHLDLFPAGLLKSGSSLFLFNPVAPSSCLSSSSLSASQGAGPSHCMPWVVTVILPAPASAAVSVSFTVSVAVAGASWVGAVSVSVFFLFSPPLVDFLMKAISAPKTTFVEFFI